MKKNENRIRIIHKLIIMIISTLIPIAIVVVFSVVDFGFTSESLYKKYAFIPPIFLVIFELGLILYIVHLIIMLVNEEYAQKIEIKKNDERLKYLKMKSDALVFKFCIYILALVTMITLFTDIYHFVICISLFASFVLVKILVYAYYLRKY